MNVFHTTNLVMELLELYGLKRQIKGVIRTRDRQYYAGV